MFYIISMLVILSCGGQSGPQNAVSDKNIRNSEDVKLIDKLQKDIKDIKDLNILVNRARNGDEGDINRTIYEMREQILSKDGIIETLSKECEEYKLQIEELDRITSKQDQVNISYGLEGDALEVFNHFVNIPQLAKIHFQLLSYLLNNKTNWKQNICSHTFTIESTYEDIKLIRNHNNENIYKINILEACLLVKGLDEYNSMRLLVENIYKECAITTSINNSIFALVEYFENSAGETEKENFNHSYTIMKRYIEEFRKNSNV